MSNQKGILKNQRGQGLVEYLVIVALMGVATIAIVRVMGQTVSARFATVTASLQGKQRSYSMDKVEDGYVQKKDLGDFFQGTSSQTARGQGK